MDAIKALKSNLPAEIWTQDVDIIAPHLVEWRDKYQGQTPLMCLPRNTDDVVLIVKLCGELGLKITPQGGNTGLVGGQTPQGEVLLSLKRMTKIRDVNSINNAMTVEAGATLQSVQESAQGVNRKFPLSLASEGSCTIGGNLSTNAGGVHVLKYGTTKDLVFGVEAVLADGSVFNGLTNLVKDNTGYDLNRLFLGAEGTLGIITAASLKLFPQPGHIQRVMVGLQSPADALKLLEMSRRGDALAMFEVLPKLGLDLVVNTIAGQRYPFDARYPWFAVLDWETPSEEEGQKIALDVLGQALDAGIIRDAIIAQNETQSAQILALRENMSAGQKALGGSIKFDITVPIQDIPAFFEQTDAAIETLIPSARPVGFGHFGDGNIHYNIGRPDKADTEKFLARWQEVSEVVFDIVESFGGSISAEHGIGIMKKDDLARRADPVKLALLRSVKNALDPMNMFNPRVLV
ncbi:MAG: FAD-binding oxidoreductase [Maricaulaceae bacterium]